MKAKAVSDYEEFELNPFLSKMSISSDRKRKYDYKTGKDAADPETGEVLETYIETVYLEERDNASFVKIFKDNIKNCFSLSVTGIKMLEYFMGEAKINKDQVFFDVKTAQNVCKFVSRTSVYKGLINLLDKDIVARVKGKNNFYFINIHVFFNGDRLVVIKDYRRSKGEIVDEPKVLSQKQLIKQPNPKVPESKNYTKPKDDAQRDGETGT